MKVSYSGMQDFSFFEKFRNEFRHCSEVHPGRKLWNAERPLLLNRDFFS
jgi:hypothetical protein